MQGIPGVGVLTATALVATVGDGQAFRNGRQLAAYLGLVPRQASSGGKDRLLGISKRGDGYLRSLLIHGARSVIRHIRRRLQAGQPGGNPWVEALLQRCHVNEASRGIGQQDGAESPGYCWPEMNNISRYRPRLTNRTISINRFTSNGGTLNGCTGNTNGETGRTAAGQTRGTS